MILKKAELREDQEILKNCLRAASRVRILDRFLTWIKTLEGVWFARKDEIARYALETRQITPHVERAPAAVSGLPGTSGELRGAAT